MPEETKVCKDCGRELPISRFARNASGYTGYCKDCMNKRRKSSQMRKLAEKKGDTPEGHLLNAVADRLELEELLHSFSDEVLVDELKSRGFNGTLTKTTRFEL